MLICISNKMVYRHGLHILDIVRLLGLYSSKNITEFGSSLYTELGA